MLGSIFSLPLSLSLVDLPLLETSQDFPETPPMKTASRSFLMFALAATFGAVSVSPASAQAAPRQQVISANPFGLLLEFFNAEYERVVGESSTAGVGGSFLSLDNEDYVNIDAFWRFYPQKVPTPLAGWAFGLKAGITRVGGESHFGAGFDVNRSWLLGKDDNFYVGIGFGLKRIVGASAGDPMFIPTFRIVNVGFAF